MNSNISCLYESMILEQQVNYFILENKYNTLNESSNGKNILSKIKNFIVEKVQSFIRIIGKFIGIIRNFLSKFFPFLKKKTNDAKKCKNLNKVMINTVDVKKAEKWINDIQDLIISNQYDTRNLDVTFGYLCNKNDTFTFKKDDLDKSKDFLKESIKMYKDNKKKISNIGGDMENVTIQQPVSVITDFYNKFEPEVKKFQDNLQKQEKYMDEVLKKCKTITIDGVDDESERQTMMNLSIEYFTSENSYITTGYNKIINIIQTMNPTKILNAIEKFPEVAGKYDTIEKGIKNNDIRSLRAAIGSICCISRDFSDGEFDEVVKYVEQHGIKLKDNELIGRPTISSQKNEFSEEDFARAIFELKKNFCDERIADVKKIGKALYGKNQDSQKKTPITKLPQSHEYFDKLIADNKIDTLKISIVNTIYGDMSFSTDELDKSIKYVEKKGIKIREPQLKGKLISASKTSFVDNDFADAVYALRNNFCDERIADVKKIGKALYGKK